MSSMSEEQGFVQDLAQAKVWPALRMGRNPVHLHRKPVAKGIRRQRQAHDVEAANVTPFSHRIFMFLLTPEAELISMEDNVKTGA